MASGYTSENVLLNAASQAVAASQTKQVVTNTFHISADDADAFRLDLTVSGHSGTVTAILQFSHDNSTWIDGKSGSVTGDGNFAIIYNPNVAGDQAYLPLPPRGRVAITTAGASGATVTAAWKACRK